MKKKAPQKKRGSRSVYSRALAARVCEAIAGGKSIRKSAESEGISPALILKWVKQNEEFREQYARACEVRLEVLSEKLIDLAEEGHVAASDPVAGNARIQAVKLEIDTIKWMLVKLMPRRYGDASKLELTGADGGPVEVVDPRSAEEDQRFAEILAAAQARVQSGEGQ